MGAWALSVGCPGPGLLIHPQELCEALPRGAEPRASSHDDLLPRGLQGQVYPSSSCPRSSWIHPQSSVLSLFLNPTDKGRESTLPPNRRTPPTRPPGSEPHPPSEKGSRPESRPGAPEYPSTGSFPTGPRGASGAAGGSRQK